MATSVLDLFEACRRASGSTSSRSSTPPRLGELQRSVLDPGLAERELGFAARTSFDDGIAATWEFIARRKERAAAGRTRPARGSSRRHSSPSALALRSVHRGRRSRRSSSSSSSSSVSGSSASSSTTRSARPTNPTTVAQAAVERQLKRARPAAEAEGATPAAQADRSRPDETSVLVLNGNGISGAAASPPTRSAGQRLHDRRAPETPAAPTSRARSSCSGRASSARRSGSAKDVDIRASRRSTASSLRDLQGAHVALIIGG